MMILTADTLYKVLGAGGQCCHGGHGQWALPADEQPGAWMPPVDGPLVPCENGYHLLREQNLVFWLGPVLWEAEYRGGRVYDRDKIIVREARLLRQVTTWNERTACLFAADCAEHTLPIFKTVCPDGTRPRKAIGVARRYAAGEVTDEEITWFAAWAAGAKAVAARNAAEYIWQTARLMQYLRGEVIR